MKLAPYALSSVGGVVNTADDAPAPSVALIPLFVRSSKYGCPATGITPPYGPIFHARQS